MKVLWQTDQHHRLHDGYHQDFWDVMALVWAGKLKAVVGRVMPLSEGKAAFEALERGEQFGKIVLAP
jgi:NADPH:quinone reductase-like Zn-dependent oxidoreductase